MTDSIKWCRHCTHSRTTGGYKINCSLHPWEEDKFSQSADVGVCPDYEDKWAKYDAQKKGATCQVK